MKTKRHDWLKTINRFLESKQRRKTIKMSSKGVAQVTRCRLYKDFNLPRGLNIRTTQGRLIMEKE